MDRKLRWWTTGCASYALAGGIVSFAGWALNLPALADWIGTGISIQPNTAIAVICASMALLLLTTGRTRACRVFGIVVAFLGGGTLFEWVSGADIGFDALLLFDRTWGATGVLHPGRMGPPASVSWTLIGTGLLLATLGSRARRFVPALGLSALTLALLSLTGYLYGADVLYTLPRLTVIALQTSTFIIALSIGLIASVPERSPARRLVEDGVAGALVRRAIPIVVLLPILLGYLRLEGQEASFYDLAFGSALRTVVEMVLLSALLWWTAGTISRQARKAAVRQRQAEATDHRLAGVLGSLSDPFMIFDKDWRVVYVNERGASELRRSHAELIGHDVWQVFPEAVGHEPYHHLHKTMRDRVSVEYETWFEPWKRWFFSKAYPTADGGVALLFRDITESKSNVASLAASREQLETELAAMVRLHAVGTRLAATGDFDVLLREILVATADITGTDKCNIQIYDPATDTLRIVAHQGYGARFLSRFENQGASDVCETAARSRLRVVIEDVRVDPRLDRSEGDRAVLLDDDILAVQSTPLVTREGKLVGVLNSQSRTPHVPTEGELRHVDLLARMAADLIERSNIDRALRDSERVAREARGDAEQASAIKDEFLATLSHELRSPLNAIMGWTRILERRGGDPRLTEEAIQIIARNAKAQSDLIADLLDMNRIISGKLRLEIGNVGLLGVIREAVETVRPALESKQLRLELALSPEADVIRGDAGRLQQVMGNLLANAVKFTPKGGRVQVVLAKSESQAVVTVSDNGDGIDARFLPHVFDRFRQADASVSREHGGLGLGLAIVKQLVELHGGTISADSPGVGLGATFTVCLPLSLLHAPPVEASSPGPRRSEAPRSNVPAEDIDLEGVTVLAVEDQRDARELLRVLLERSHARVMTAGSADEALILVERIRPDIILCDVGMPGKNGYDFITELRRRQNRTPALAVTAFARTEDKVRALRAGFHAHVAKPIEPAELLSTVAVFAKVVRR